MIQDIATAAVLLLLLFVSLEVGFRFGRRARGDSELTGGGQVGAIQGGKLGLLALLLAFSFGGAASQFFEKQDLIVQEANAIGTAYLRADMLDEPYRTSLRSALANYVEHRVRLSQTLRHGVSPQDQLQIAQMHDQIWKAASEGANAKPAAIIAVLPPVNDVIDFHSTRVAAGRKHLPRLVVGLLIICSAMSMMDIGYGCGLSGRRTALMTATLALLIAASLWATLDLDKPRAGLIQLDDSPLTELATSLRR